MAVEERRGICGTCGGGVRRVPYPGDDFPDRWVHNRTADWVDNPHEVDPQPVPQPPEEQP